MPAVIRDYYRVLTIAGSDSGGGAGIQADLKTFSALGVYGMTAITALTAQNTQQVSSIFEIDSGFVADQIDAVLSDIEANAIKIGMLYQTEIVSIVARKLMKFQAKNIVLDPVMVAKSGDLLLKEEAIEILKKELLPLATIVTPNLPETSVLVGKEVKTPEQMESAARELVEMGPHAVLVKGGHSPDFLSCDCLGIKTTGGLVEIHWLKSKRVPTKNTHGTGCTLSAAIAAFLALGFDPFSSIAKAKTYITNAIQKGSRYRLGHGHGPVHHFH